MRERESGSAREREKGKQEVKWNVISVLKITCHSKHGGTVGKSDYIYFVKDLVSKCACNGIWEIELETI